MPAFRPPVGGKQASTIWHGLDRRLVPAILAFTRLSLDVLLGNGAAMPGSDQFTAFGPAAVGFQTDGTEIDRGAEISGNTFGVMGSGTVAGVIGEGVQDGVHGK